VKSASVTINDREHRSINRGLVIFLGITHSDTLQDAQYLADKSTGLRIFSDSSGKMNLSILDLENPKGECLIVSQFTLYGDARKGKRPSFIDAASPEIAIPLYESFVKNIEQTGITVKTGEFGADMQVELINDGPVTIILDSSRLF
jgi:D-tyrosyl-tRNA(Tyr) deacylase